MKWRDAGVVERDGLENHCRPKAYRRFESCSLRQNTPDPRATDLRSLAVTSFPVFPPRGYFPRSYASLAN